MIRGMFGDIGKRRDLPVREIKYYPNGRSHDDPHGTAPLKKLANRYGRFYRLAEKALDVGNRGVKITTGLVVPLTSLMTAGYCLENGIGNPTAVGALCLLGFPLPHMALILGAIYAMEKFSGKHEALRKQIDEKERAPVSLMDARHIAARRGRRP